MIPIVLHHDLAAAFAVIAFVYSYLLTQSDQIFSGWYKLLERLLMAKTLELKRGGCEMNRIKRIVILDWICFTWNKRLRDYEWLFKILGGCYQCFCGQAALWGYLIILWHYGLPYNVFEHLYVVTASILFTTLLKNFYQWTIKLAEN